MAYLYEEDSLRQTLEKMDRCRYSAIPIIGKEDGIHRNPDGGDLLRYIKDKEHLDLRRAEEIPLSCVPRRWYNDPVNVNCNMEDLLLTLH